MENVVIDKNGLTDLLEKILNYSIFFVCKKEEYSEQFYKERFVFPISYIDEIRDFEVQHINSTYKDSNTESLALQKYIFSYKKCIFPELYYLIKSILSGDSDALDKLLSGDSVTELEVLIKEEIIRREKFQVFELFLNFSTEELTELLKSNLKPCPISFFYEEAKGYISSPSNKRNLRD